MSYKHIEGARELRLWITQIIVPAVILGGTIIAMNPELKDKTKEKIYKVRNSVKANLKKKGDICNE